jgi:hypothetical protein
MRSNSGRLFLALCTALAVFASIAAAQSTSFEPQSKEAIALATAPPTPQEIEDLKWMREHTKVGTPYTMDLSQPNQYRFLMTMLRRAGDSKERSPHMFSLLEASSRRGVGTEPKIAVITGPEGQATGAPQTLAYIGKLDSTGPQSYAATGLLSVEGGTVASQIVMTLLWNDQTYAANQGAQYGQGQYFSVPVSGTAPSGNGPSTTEANAAFIYIAPGTNAPVVSYYRGEDTINPTNACMQLPNYCVRSCPTCNCTGSYQTACTNAVTNTTPIKVCYTRGSPNECDYFYPGPAHPTNFVFPLQGNAQFSQNIFASGTTPTGAVTITLENPLKGGGCYLTFQQLAPLAAANWTVPTATPNQLNWNFTGASFPDPNSCLEYYNDTNTYMHVQVNALVMTNQQFGQFEFTSDRSQIGQPGVYIVPQIQIQQGCLAAGTRIRLADGTTKPIETFAYEHPDIVKSGGGNSKVLDVTKGIEDHPMIRLRTDEGQEILVTRTHPIMTPTGAVMASALKPQDMVLTAEGPARLAQVSLEIYTGKVYNLRVGSNDDPDIAHMTLEANGFIVGDARMQSALEKQEQKRQAVRPVAGVDSLPVEWRADFLHHQNENQ